MKTILAISKEKKKKMPLSSQIANAEKKLSQFHFDSNLDFKFKFTELSLSNVTQIAFSSL